MEIKRTSQENSNVELLTTFYQAFQRKDPDTMASCYHRDATFGDPAFADDFPNG